MNNNNSNITSTNIIDNVNNIKDKYFSYKKLKIYLNDNINTSLKIICVKFI